MISKPDKNKLRQKRHRRVRGKLSGTADRPRLNVFRSNTGIYAQVIDDVAGVTLASASTLDKEVSKGTKTEQAVAVGKLVAERANAKGISEVVFDRGGYLYHGRVKALADAARENGLKKELFELRFQAATGQLEQTARLKEVKKQIARIKTVQSEAK